MKPCNSYISKTSIKLIRLFCPQAEICLASRLAFLQVLTNQDLLTPFSLCLLHMHPELSQMLKTFSTLCSFPSPNLDRVFPKKKNAKEKVFLSFHYGFLYQNPAPPTSTFVFSSFSSGKCPHEPRKPAP